MEADEIRAALVEGLASLELAQRRFTELLAELDGLVGIQVPRQGRWTPAMVDQLWASVAHLPGVRALFEVTADHPNQAVSFGQVLARSGLTPLQQRNEHAVFSRTAARLFGEKRWPIENWQSGPGVEGKTSVLYRMGGTVATWWHEIVAERTGVSEAARHGER